MKSTGLAFLSPDIPLGEDEGAFRKSSSATFSVTIAPYAPLSRPRSLSFAPTEVTRRGNEGNGSTNPRQMSA